MMEKIKQARGRNEKRDSEARNEIVKRETRSRSEIKFALNPFVG